MLTYYIHFYPEQLNIEKKPRTDRKLHYMIYFTL